MFDFSKLGLNLNEVDDEEAEVNGTVEPVKAEESEELQFGSPETEENDEKTRPSFFPFEETAKQLVSDIVSAESSVKSAQNEGDIISDENGLKQAKNEEKQTHDENVNKMNKLMHFNFDDSQDEKLSVEQFAMELKKKLSEYSPAERKTILDIFKTKEEREAEAAISYRDELIKVCDTEIEKLKQEKQDVISASEKIKEETEARLKEKDIKLDEFFKNKQSLEKEIDELKHILSEKTDIENAKADAEAAMEQMKEKMSHLQSEVDTYKQQLAENEKGHKLLKAKYEATTDMLRSEEELRTKAEASVATLRQELVELYNKFVEKC